MVRRSVLFVSVLAMIAALLFTTSLSSQQGMVQAQDYETGNVIFIHPDGTGLNHWGAGRMYWYGPDGVLEWDQLPEMAVYRGHMTDRLTGTSNGGATVHAFGYKVEGPGSYGQDGGGDTARPILSLSGYPGSIMREAANAGHPVGIVNDGDLPEPGTGVFLAEVADRNESNEIARQLLDGRPGFEDEAQPLVMLGGGESFFLPEGTPRCASAEAITPECAVHIDPVDGGGPARTDGRNLIQEAIDDGYVVIRTRAEFESLWAEIQADPNYAPKVLGLFAADDIFNDVPEETLIELGLVDDRVPAGDEVVTDFTFGETTDYLDLPAGNYQIEVVPTGTTNPAIAGTVTLTSGQDYTAAAIGDGNNQPLELLVLEDDNSAPTAGNAKVRIVHAAPFADTLPETEVDIRTEAGDVVNGLTNVPYKGNSGYFELPADTYDLKITTPGGATTLIDVPPVTLNAGDIVTVFAIGDGTNQPTAVLTVPGSPRPEPLAVPRLTVAHLAPFANEIEATSVSVNANSKEGRLIIWGDKPDTLGYTPPTAGEMTEMALELLGRQSQTDDKPFLLVTEVESTDNLGNNDNAIGMLRALKRADDVIGAARDFQEEVPNTLILTAADSDAGGMQVVSPPPTDDAGNVTTVAGNTVASEPVPFPVDGIEGAGTPPFIAAEDAYGQELPFAVAWIGLPDVAGGILARSQGLNAELQRDVFFSGFDNTDVYRHMYITLFGELLPSAVGKTAPTRTGDGDIQVMLMPEDATNKVGTEHTVTATVLDADGQPLVKEVVSFAVSGANETSGSATTDANGEASFTYTGNDEGEDTITAWLDQNGNSEIDADEPQATASKTWEAMAAISLVSFTASVDGERVTLTWETGAEIDNAGFNLYRATRLDGAYTQINAALIPAEGDVFAGASYSFVDTPGSGTFYYLLEDVDMSGKTTTHGPVKVEL